MITSITMFQSAHPHGMRYFRRGRTGGDGYGFNQRTRTGCDHLWREGTATAFQSAHPHGMRFCIKAFFIGSACFNQRTRTGCDSR